MESTVAGRVLFGREPQLTTLRGVVAAGDRVRSVLLVGGAGIGKTALWEAGLDLARAHGRHVLTARASEAEAGLGFAGLIDLFDGLGAEVLDGLPAPQRAALDVALLRADATGTAPEPTAIGLGLLNVVRTLAAAGPVVVAIDDLPWLDAPSAAALAFAARRLADARVCFLLARRPGRAGDLERELAPERVDVGPLDDVATGHLLASRLGLSPPRALLRRLVEHAQGNPLFALEIGRSLRDTVTTGPGQDIPVPATIGEALAVRVGRLAPDVRRLLVAVALGSALRREELEAVGGVDAVDAALDAGVLSADGSRVRASHPLLAAVAKKRSRRGERRELHLALAQAVADDELRALHLALAADRVDGTLAVLVADAAARASARGARIQAVQLAEHALRLTPGQADERHDRLLALAEYLSVAGATERMSELLEPAVESLPPGIPKARAWLLLSDAVGVDSLAEYERRLDRAIAEARAAPPLRAQAIAAKTTAAAVVGVARVAEAEAWARDALAAVQRRDPAAERRVLYSLAWATALRGCAVDELCARFRAVSDESFFMVQSPERVAGQRLVWRGETQPARAVLSRLLTQADEQGEPLSYALQRLHLCELELRIGVWDAAERLLDEWAESAERGLLKLPMYERCRALLAAGRGDADGTRRWANEALARADAYGAGWDRLEALRARGTAALLAHEPAAAAADLETVWQHTQREGVGEPGVFPIAPDLVEALVEAGRRDDAQEVAAWLRRRARELAHPWGRLSATRCDAVLQLAGARYDAAAAEALHQVAAGLGRLDLAFDSARSRLSLGEAQRRHKQWGAARASLERAAAAFSALGSPGWAERARAEAARISGRRPAQPGTLTPSERDIAELVAQGLANKEIAHRLTISVHTVEAHLSHAYRKLGVRSRTQLAAHLTARASDPANR